MTEIYNAWLVTVIPTMIKQMVVGLQNCQNKQSRSLPYHHPLTNN